MTRWMLLGLVLAACYRPRLEGECEVGCAFGADPACPTGLTCGQDNLCHAGAPCSDRPDAHVDDVLPDALDPSCASAPFVGTVCLEGTAQVRVLTGPLDTDAQCDRMLLGAGNVAICVIEAETLTIATPVRVTGSRPLLLFATQQITIEPTGILDVSVGGTGVDAACAGADGSDQIMTGVPAGGGAGGSHAHRGGNGGAASSGPAPAPAPMPITTLRGGCRGGTGGERAAGGGAGEPGLGGGAAQLLSPGTVQVAGSIFAYGGGGGGAVGGSAQAAGGGGGGSGGLIAIRSRILHVEATARLLAHGGGGGGGAAGNLGSGSDGDDANTADGDAAPGGNPVGGSSTRGGDGSSDLALMGQAAGLAMDTSGAGGGGGGAGAIYVLGTTSIELVDGAQIHPSPIITP